MENWIVPCGLFLEGFLGEVLPCGTRKTVDVSDSLKV